MKDPLKCMYMQNFGNIFRANLKNIFNPALPVLIWVRSSALWYLKHKVWTWSQFPEYMEVPACQ